MNPLKLHTNGMFATRETFDNAMAFAHELINSISDKQAGDKIAALTALMVVVNTASKLWPEADAQTPSTQVSILLSRQDLDALIQSKITDWASDEFDARADEWLNDHADIGQEIETWMENNFDLESEVQDVLRGATLKMTF